MLLLLLLFALEEVGKVVEAERTGRDRLGSGTRLTTGFVNVGLGELESEQPDRVSFRAASFDELYPLNVQLASLHRRRFGLGVLVGAAERDDFASRAERDAVAATEGE